MLKVSNARRLPEPNIAFSNMIRVHLGQTVLQTFNLVEAPKILTEEPLRIIADLPGQGGHRERSWRCTQVARQALALYSLTPDCPQHAITEIVRAGHWAYRLAADEVGSFDRDFGDLWWEMGDGFIRYAEVIAESSRLLNKSA